MPGRRYPRPGQRLAPRSLAEVLQKALPPEYAEQGGEEFSRLCDLDETSWDRFGTGACKALAAEVVCAVGRAARQPTSFASLKLPPIPAGMSLADLELESRTHNCLAAAGIADRPQDLGRMTIEAALALRGFWSKCLVDLLTAIEYAADHPETRRKPRNVRLDDTRRRKTFGRYPRRGYRIAPASLRDILDVPVPGHQIANSVVRGRNLCDLDEKISLDLSDEELEILGRAIIARVNVNSHKRLLRDRRLPAPPKGMRLQDLALENRTFNCLARAGIGTDFEDIAKYTIGDLLDTKAFGAKCLLDLLSSIETTIARSATLDEELTREAATLGRLPETRLVHFSDPRLGAMVREIDHEAETLSDLAERIIHRRIDPPDPSDLARQLSLIRLRIRDLSRMDLGDELAEIFSTPSQPRDREIISEYFGWDGRGKRTLEELGKRHNLSRERIRQVCMRASKRHSHTRVFAPALDRALEFVNSRVPIATRELKHAFESAGLAGLFLPPETICQAARFLSRDGEFAAVTVDDAELVVDSKAAHLPRTIAQLARRVALASGIVAISEVVRQVESRHAVRVESDLVRTVAQALDNFRWLDQAKTWFHLESGSQYGMPNMIEKVFSVCPRIDVASLRAALQRHRRSDRRVPPSRVLLAYCRQRSDISVEGRSLVAKTPSSPDETLSGVERVLVRVLREHGPALDRGAFEEHCLTRGLNRFSFNATLMGSPVIAQLGRSVYGLVGTKMSSKRIRSLAAKRSGGAGTRVLRGFGPLADGRVYLSYRLSKAAISGGVTTVPADMKKRVEGTFTVRLPDGEESGKLVARGGCAWGLGPALRNQHARPGDHMVLLFDLQQKLVHVYLGEQDLLDTLIESLSLNVAETRSSEPLATVTDR